MGKNKLMYARGALLMHIAMLMPPYQKKSQPIYRLA